ncbi:MAG: indolepyruvate oxidoreductase subunit beta [Anaerolineaceae bacterium]|nr:indolepyruvate oxidoreductase subunit beta [Anaerolineaceae bacterium]
MITELLKNEKDVFSFMLVGVGGQGTILASDVIAGLGMSLGYDVKKAEVHGMSQRGGSVTSHVRWGKRVNSPIIADGQADIMIAFEKVEAARFAKGLKPDGIVLINDYRIVPITVSSGGQSYPDDKSIDTAIKVYSKNVNYIDGIGIAESAGTVKAANVVLLGALSKLLEMDEFPWVEAIKMRVPEKFLAINMEAFNRGRVSV